jgi:hypothetical protein
MCSHAQAGVQTQSAAQLADCSVACSSTLQSRPRAALSAPRAVGGVTLQRCSQQRAELLKSSSRRQRKTFLPKVPLRRVALSAQFAAAAVVTTTEQRSLQQQRLTAAAESKQQQRLREWFTQLGTHLFFRFFLQQSFHSQQNSR